MFWVTLITSIVALLIILSWYYYRNVDWQIKLLTARLKRAIHLKKRDQRVVQQLLKKIYVIIQKSTAENNSIVVYQSLDLLKLAFGYGLVRSNESTRLMAVGIAALRSKNYDTASFVLDTFRPLVRQLPASDNCIAIDQLTLIGVLALKQKQNFLTAKVVECIFFIMEQTDVAVDRKVLASAIKALKVIGVLGLRRRDTALFREITIRLSSWLIANPRTNDITEEIATMLTAWLHRIVWLDEGFLFVIITDFTFSLVEAQVLSAKGVELIVDEWGSIAASASLNPRSSMAGVLVEFLFKIASVQKTDKQWNKVVDIAGRVAKLAVSRRGLMDSFMVLHPMLEIGKDLLWAQLQCVEAVDVSRQQLLYKVIRECLIVLTYAARQDLLGSTGESIISIYEHWRSRPECISNQKTLKKYCQLLLLFWLKNKRKSKREMAGVANFIDPILFSNRERQRLGI